MNSEKSNIVVIVAFFVFALVVTAMIALTVSNSILSKIDYIDESLQKERKHIDSLTRVFDNIKRDTSNLLKK